ncbi:MAG: esterase family protein [Acidobacteria bacterium]|nr:esterase family protein [Acidobacteriota bacterium]
MSVCLVFLIGSASAQSPAPAPLAANVAEHELESKLMGRQMPYRVVLPKSYAAEKDKKYPVVYLLHGLTGRYRNWTDLTKLPSYAEGHEFIIVTPEGGNGWYTDSHTKAEEKYESYIIKELIPEVEKRYRSVGTRGGRAIAGLSMGGYGAIKFGLKYPDMFALAGSFSGALGAASLSGEGRSTSSIRSIGEVFGPADSETRAANDIFKMVRESTPEKVKAMPFLYVDCGTEDFLFQNNRDFVALLAEKKIPHEYRQLPGAHNWPYWDKQVREFLRVAENFIGTK